MGNVTTCNDYVALVHPDLDRVNGFYSFTSSVETFKANPALELDFIVIGVCLEHFQFMPSNTRLHANSA